MEMPPSVNPRSASWIAAFTDGSMFVPPLALSASARLPES